MDAGRFLVKPPRANVGRKIACCESSKGRRPGSIAARERPVTARKRQPLDHNSLDLIETHLIAPAIVELRRARRGVIRHRGGLFERPAVLEIGGDARRPEVVVAELGCDAGCRRAPADHRVGVCLLQHRPGEHAGAPADRAEQWPLGIVAQARAVEIGNEVFIEVVVARHRVPLAALLPQPHP